MPPFPTGRNNTLAEHAIRALTRVFTDQAPALRGFFARRGANDEAEDLVQETYLRLLRAHQGQGERIANPEAYLFTVALNLAREQAARRQRTPVPMEDVEQLAALVTHADDGVLREVPGLRVIAYNIPEGCIGAYYPECNPLIPVWHHAEESKVPAAKSIPVTVRKTEAI